MSKFTDKPNLQLLWDVLLDELNITNVNTSLMSNIQSVFNSNINLFISRANSKTPLVELNKQFLSQVLLAVSKLYPTPDQNQNIKRITITNEEVVDPYKIEDIHAERQTEFEKELNKKKIELETYLSLPKPKDVVFADQNSDSKITAMDALIAEKMAERNLDLEIVQKNNNNSNPDTWLSSLETSVKGEKNVLGEVNSFTTNTNGQKKVSWIDEEPVNIFQKLKKTNDFFEPIGLVINELNEPNDLTKKTYDQQPSTKLSAFEQQNILPIPPTPVTNAPPVITQVSPLIPQSEVIKQLNEMNTKVDVLYNVVDKLTNYIHELLSQKNNNSNTDNTDYIINDDDDNIDDSVFLSSLDTSI
jgi:hypothetical protein